jgi:hypothetical protein
MDAVQEAAVQKPITVSPIVSVPKINARDLPYDAFLRDYVATNRPVVIQDAAPGWSAMKSWTPEYFKSHFGEQVVEVTYGVKQKLADVMDGVLASTAEKPGSAQGHHSSAHATTSARSFSGEYVCLSAKILQPSDAQAFSSTRWLSEAADRRRWRQISLDAL